MLKIMIKGQQLMFGEQFSITFERTLRIPDDGKTYPLPPTLGQFPIKHVSDYVDKVPEKWRKHGGVFIPMYQREAMWLNFHNGERWKPRALKIAIGKVNVVSGEVWQQALKDEEEDYLVCPPQPWLDGINSGDGYIKQFVAMPLGMGYTVEGQVTGKEEYGGLQIIVYEPKPGKFKKPPPQKQERVLRTMTFSLAAPAGAEMGLGAGGKMKQKIYPDPHGIETWDTDNYGRVFVHIVNSMTYREITGEEAPPTPISAKTYAQHNYPWFDLYDEKMDDIDAPDKLKGVKSVNEMDKEKGFEPQQDDDSVETPNIKKYKIDPDEVEDGDW